MRQRCDACTHVVRGSLLSVSAVLLLNEHKKASSSKRVRTGRNNIITSTNPLFHRGSSRQQKAVFPPPTPPLPPLLSALVRQRSSTITADTLYRVCFLCGRVVGVCRGQFCGISVVNVVDTMCDFDHAQVCLCMQ